MEGGGGLCCSMDEVAAAARWRTRRGGICYQRVVEEPNREGDYLVPPWISLATSGHERPRRRREAWQPTGTDVRRIGAPRGHRRVEEGSDQS